MFSLEKEIWLPRPIEEVFAFFSDAANLPVITPPSMHFANVLGGPIEMKKGIVLHHRLRLHGIPLQWVSEITQWEPPHRFVDEQRRGPYRLWRHEHIFVEKDGGTLVRDSVRYAVPGGVLIDRLFVARDLQTIFEYRYEKLKELFGGA